MRRRRPRLLLAIAAVFAFREAARGAGVPNPASRAALAAMRGFVAVAAAEDVRTGELVATAASEPSKLDVDTPLLPLSVAKLWLAASCWDRIRGREPVSVHEMLVGGSDDDGRRLASELRTAAGSKAIVSDLGRFGAATTLTEATDDATWADALSIGEANLETTMLRVSTFLRAVGNDGAGNAGSVRVLQPKSARRLQAAMLDAVARGTGREIANALSGTGWRIAGKTGSGPGPGPVGPQSDGWFAGLLVDPDGRARFTVASYVRRGGKGGGNAAQICAEIARSLVVSQDTAARSPSARSTDARRMARLTE
jgi:hypothetical protein